MNMGVAELSAERDIARQAYLKADEAVAAAGVESRCTGMQARLEEHDQKIQHQSLEIKFLLSLIHDHGLTKLPSGDRCCSYRELAEKHGKEGTLYINSTQADQGEAKNVKFLLDLVDGCGLSIVPNGEDISTFAKLANSHGKSLLSLSTRATTGRSNSCCVS